MATGARIRAPLELVMAAALGDRKKGEAVLIVVKAETDGFPNMLCLLWAGYV